MSATGLRLWYFLGFPCPCPSAIAYGMLWHLTIPRLPIACTCHSTLPLNMSGPVGKGNHVAFLSLLALGDAALLLHVATCVTVQPWGITHPAWHALWRTQVRDGLSPYLLVSPRISQISLPSVAFADLLPHVQSRHVWSRTRADHITVCRQRTRQRDLGMGRADTRQGAWQVGVTSRPIEHK